jgi:hypothetical protein
MRCIASRIVASLSTLASSCPRLRVVARRRVSSTNQPLCEFACVSSKRRDSRAGGLPGPWQQACRRRCCVRLLLTRLRRLPPRCHLLQLQLALVARNARGYVLAAQGPYSSAHQGQRGASLGADSGANGPRYGCTCGGTC